MPTPVELRDGRSFDTNVSFSSGFGFYGHGDTTSRTVPVIGFQNYALTMREQAVAMGGAHHTLVIDVAAGANQTRIASPILLVTPGGGPLNLTFPTAAKLGRTVLWVRNLGTAGQTILIKNSAGTTIAYLPSGTMAMAYCDGTTLRANVSGTSSTPVSYLPTDTATAMLITESAGNIMVIDTTTGARKVDWTEIRSTWTNALVAAGNLADFALTVSHISDAFSVVYATNVHNSARDPGSVVSIYTAVIDSDGTDSAGAFYNAYSAVTDGTGGIRSAYAVGPNFDYSLDLSQCGSGEGLVALPSNKAIAFGVVQGASSFFSVRTTTGSPRVTVACPTKAAFTQAPALRTDGAEVSTDSRLVLVERWNRVPLVNGSIGIVANPDWELQGTNAADGDATVYAGGGLQLATHGGLNDSTIVTPHEDAGQSAWYLTTWLGAGEIALRGTVRTLAAIGTLRFEWGLRATRSAFDDATDNDKVFLKFDTTGPDTNWELVYEVAGGGDVTIDTGVAVSINTAYAFSIIIDSTRAARVYINGELVATTPALGAGDLGKPYAGVRSQNDANAKYLVVRPISLAMNYR